MRPGFELGISIKAHDWKDGSSIKTCNESWMYSWSNPGWENVDFISETPTSSGFPRSEKTTVSAPRESVKPVAIIDPSVDS